MKKIDFAILEIGLYKYLFPKGLHYYFPYKSLTKFSMIPHNCMSYPNTSLKAYKLYWDSVL